MNNIVRNISNNEKGGKKAHTNVFYVMENHGYQKFNRV